MLKNYLKIAFRDIFRNKLYSLINIAGLAIGMAACITVFVYVQHEYSFDSFEKKANRIYRINTEVPLNGRRTRLAFSPATLGPFLMSQFPQIEGVVRFFAYDFIGPDGRPVLRYRDKVLRAKQFVLVDSSFFRMFSFKMIQGNPATALALPLSVVLTKDAAEKFFGDKDPVGKTIVYNGKFRFTVTGVVQNPPANSTIQFDYLGSLTSLPDLSENRYELSSGIQFDYYTYLLLNRGSTITHLDRSVQKVLSGYWGKDLLSLVGRPTVYFEGLSDLYWDNSVGYDIPVKGSRASVAAFTVIAAIVLLIACGNFVNLTTARSLLRAKEVGIRKVVGGKRRQLVIQFMLESALTSFMSLLAAIGLSEPFVIGMNRLLGTSLQVNYLHDPPILCAIIGIWVLTSLLSGILPALYLSSLHPVRALKLGRRGGTGKNFGRQLLIVSQFSAAIALIFCTIVIAKEYHILKYHNIGFDKANILVLNYDQAINGDYRPFQQRLLQDPRILGVAAAEALPGGTFSGGPFFFNGRSKVETMQSSFGLIGPDYIPVLGMKLVAGRNFSLDGQNENTYILNQAAIRKIGWSPQEAIGQPFSDIPDSLNGSVIGIVKDFNFRSLRYSVQPMVFMKLRQNGVHKIAVRISPKNIGATLAFIQKEWKEIFPNSPIEYSFLDTSLDALYKSEEKVSVLFTWLSFLAIVVACSGLYGLALYAAERRTKEVGIRKVLGASVPEIVLMLSKEFTRWVLVGNVIAWPVAYFVMHRWLQNFAYRTNIGLWIFPFSGGIALLLALLTVGSHAVRAARANPVEALRYE